MMADVSPHFAALLFGVSVFAGATASVVGFGIGSLLTPIVAIRFGTGAAIVFVALPHLVGGLVRGWRLRNAVDRRVLVHFGILSAAGGLAGAFLFAELAAKTLTPILGVLLVMTSLAGLLDLQRRWRPRGIWVRSLGILSGFFGGVVGNQGGLRAAALSALRLEPAAFVATSTVIGVMIDLARTPVYLVNGWARLSGLWPLIALATAGVLGGTFIGERVLLGLSPARFRVVVAAAVGLLGLWFLFRPS
jgi:uncharacterized membrane protein YfcA